MNNAINFQKIPALFRPTEIIVVDDDSSFLEGFLFFIPDDIKCRTFQHPQLAIDYLNNPLLTSKHEEQYLTINEEQEEYPTIDINIYKEIYNKNRFNEVSVLVADYSMPRLTGIELCNSIENKRIKKLLLTGEASNELAVQAFNNNEIDKFLLKKAKNIYGPLLKYIIDLQILYHEDLSYKSFPSFLMSGLDILKDDRYIHIFNNIIKKFEIVEFYILDENGSYIMLNDEGVITLFIVRKKSDIVEQVDFVKTFDVSQNIIDDLEQCKRFPFFFSEDDFSVSPENWEKYMHKCNKINDNSEYYYAIINNPSIYKFDEKEITSYKKHLDI